jgi:hypothetical protein
MTWRVALWMLATVALLIAVMIYARRQRSEPSETVQPEPVQPEPEEFEPEEPEPQEPAAEPPPHDAAVVSSTADHDLPITLGTGNVQVTVDLNGMSIHDHGKGFSTAWRLRCFLPWHKTVSLHFATGVHDSIISVYAVVRSESQRRHILDRRNLTDPEWELLGEAIERATGGRLQLDWPGFDAFPPRDE